MKTTNYLKLITLSFVLTTLFSLTSCQTENIDSETIQNEQNNSESAKLVTNLLNDSTNNNTGITSGNLQNKLRYDFGFNFNYPVTFTYNNGSTATISNDEQFFNLIESLTDSSYIDGVDFPFDVETDNDSNLNVGNEFDFSDVINSADDDGDGNPNYSDNDDDGDGISDDNEDGDDDGIPDDSDNDDDNDDNGDDDGNGDGD